MNRYVKRRNAPPCRTKEEKKKYNRWYYEHVTRPKMKRRGK